MIFFFGFNWFMIFLLELNGMLWEKSSSSRKSASRVALLKMERRVTKSKRDIAEIFGLNEQSIVRKNHCIFCF
uniref:HTH psq-type domain-containing protein n=1 Tax=Noccaea caerulescens TaxID=107243 RepID=A0A1J3J6M1_NOCCA